MTNVTVPNAFGGVFGVPITNFYDALIAQFAVYTLYQPIADAKVVPFIADGTPLPPIPAGEEFLIYQTAPLPLALPDTVPAWLFSNTGAAATITSGAASGDFIIAADGGIDFTAGAGLFNLFAGDGKATVNLAAGVGGGVVVLGDGDATVNAIGGNTAFYAGQGNHALTFGIGANVISAAGSNTILGGPGNISFSRPLNNALNSGQDLVLFGSGNNQYVSFDAGAAATLASATGSDTILGSAAPALYFAGSGTGYFTGAGTVAGAAGPLNVNATGNLLLYAGTGVTAFTTRTASATIAGNPSGTMLLNPGGGNLLLYSQGATTLQGGTGAATVLGVSGSLQVSQEAGLFLAPPGGNSHINVTGNATVFGAAAGDVLSAADRPGQPALGATTVILAAGAGAETISGAGSTANASFFTGPGPNFVQAGDWHTTVTINAGSATVAGGAGQTTTNVFAGQAADVVMQGFNPARDALSLHNFPADTAAAVLAAAQIAGGSEILTLPDGTHITFAGLTGITAASFL